MPYDQGDESILTTKHSVSRLGPVPSRGSNGIAEFVGEALADAMGWQVDLHDYDLEVQWKPGMGYGSVSTMAIK